MINRITAPTWAEINLDNIKFNLNNIRKLLKKDTKVCGIVKANAYGHGSVMVAKLLEKENVINTLIIVIRYFGGILLGAGPLTRAYSTVAKEALAKCEKKEYIEYDTKTLECEYKEEEQTTRTLKQQGCIIENIIRTDKVTIEYLEPKGM